MHNLDCDGNVAGACRGEVRVLPYPGGNLNLCHAHYFREMVWRRERNKTVASPYALPAWESLRELREVEREPIPSRNEYECRREDDDTGYDECRWPACDCPPKEREPLPEYEGR